jgi:hypothetical protein
MNLRIVIQYLLSDSTLSLTNALMAKQLFVWTEY